VIILFVGDIYGRPGRRAAAEIIPRLRRQRGVEFCIANGENAAGGFGITETIARALHSYGVDVITGGNHIWDHKEAVEYVQRGGRILRPANYPPEVGGLGATIVETEGGTPVGVLNLQGRTYTGELDCPFRVGRGEVERLNEEVRIVVVDFHGEATSEKMAFGWYIDGEVSAVMGTHTHVQTSDERILPGGTAYITDVGMTGPHDSVIGVRKELAIRRFLTQMPTKFEPARGNVRLCGVLIDVDEATGRARTIERLIIPLEGSMVGSSPAKDER